MRTSLPTATLLLVAAMLVLFCFENAMGGSGQTAVLVRMGGVVRERLASEPWRVLASALLHNGIAHLLLSAFVLVTTGLALEGLLGPWRVISVFTLSAAGASAGAAWWGGGRVIVGSSGGAWGLLAGSAVLASWPKRQLQPIQARLLQNNLAVALPICLICCLLPGSSTAALAGGAVIGGLLVMASGLARIGPTQDGDQTPEARSTWSVRPLGAACLVLLTASTAAAWRSGDAIGLLRPLVFARHPIEGTRFSVELPVGFVEGKPQVTTERGATMHTLQFGTPEHDPAVYVVEITALPDPLTPREAEAWVSEIQASADEAAKKYGPPLWVEKQLRGVFPGYGVRFALPDGRLFERVAEVRTDSVVAIEVYWPQSQPRFAGAADFALGTVEERK